MANNESDEAHLKFSSNVSALKDHITNKMEQTRQQADSWNLTETSLESLLSHMQSELDFLENLPDDMTFGEIMERHFESAKDRNDYYWKIQVK